MHTTERDHLSAIFTEPRELLGLEEAQSTAELAFSDLQDQALEHGKA